MPPGALQLMLAFQGSPVLTCWVNDPLSSDRAPCFLCKLFVISGSYVHRQRLLRVNTRLLNVSLLGRTPSPH